METSDFRKPRPDFPIVPQSAIFRQPVKGWKVPKGRKGKKPRKGKVPPFKPFKRPRLQSRYAIAKTQEISENAKDRRERLVLEKDIAKETIRYRTLKAETQAAEREQQVEREAAQIERGDRLLIDAREHHLAQIAQGERRHGEQQALYQDFIQQVMSQRNLQDKPVEGIKIVFTEPEQGVELEEVEEAEEHPTTTALRGYLKGGAQTGGGFKRNLPAQDGGGEGLPRQRSTSAERQRKRDILGGGSPRGGVSGASPRGGVQSPPYDAQRTRREEGGGAAEEAKLSPEVGYQEGEEARGFGGVARRARRGGMGSIAGMLSKTPRSAPPPAPTPEPEPQQETAEDKARAFLANAPLEYKADFTKSNAPQTKKQLGISQEWLSHQEDLKPTTFQELSKSFKKGEPLDVRQTNKQVFMVVSDKFGGAAAEKHAGVYKVRQLPTQKKHQSERHDKNVLVLQSVFGDEEGGKSTEERFGDITTINPYKREGVVFQSGIDTGKINFFVMDRDDV